MLFIKVVYYINRILIFISGVMLTALMALGVTDVIGRYFLGMPIEGCYGMSEVLLVGLVFFAWSYTQGKDSNVRVETFFINFRLKVQSLVGMFSSIVGILMFSIMLWQSAMKAIESMEYGDIIDVVNIPIYPFQFFVSIGSGALCLQLIVDFIQAVKTGKGEQ